MGTEGTVGVEGVEERLLVLCTCVKPHLFVAV